MSYIEATKFLADPKYWTDTFARAFLDSWDDEVFRQPKIGVRLATVGMELVTRVEERKGEKLPVLRARALTIRGSSCRITGNLGDARKYYNEALNIYDELEEPLDEADLYRRRVFLHRDLEEWREALNCAKLAAKIFLAAGDKQRYGMTLIVKATVFTRNGHPEQAIPILSKALASLDYERSPYAFYSGVHNIAAALAQASNPSPEILDTALRWLRDARRASPSRGVGTKLYGYRKRTIPDAKLRHVIGLILGRSGKLRPATRLLEQARDDLVELGLPLDVVGVALDLGDLYAQSGRWESLKQISSDTFKILASVPHLSRLKKALRQWQTALIADAQQAEITARCRELLPHHPAPEVLEASDEGRLRRRMARSIDSAVRGCHDLEELGRRLAAEDITLHFRPGSGDRPAGIAFELQGRRFTGHQLGRPYRLAGIRARLDS